MQRGEEVVDGACRRRRRPVELGVRPRWGLTPWGLTPEVSDTDCDGTQKLTTGVCHGMRNTATWRPDASEEVTREQVVARERVSGGGEEKSGNLHAVFQHDPPHGLLDLDRHILVQRLEAIVRRTRDALHPDVRPIVQLDQLYEQRQASVLSRERPRDEKRRVRVARDGPRIAVRSEEHTSELQ